MVVVVVSNERGITRVNLKARARECAAGVVVVGAQGARW
jgi:hypothetical protein